MFHSTNSKLLFLMVTMLVGMGSLFFALLKDQEASEYHIKTMYFGSLLPVSNLKEIIILLERDVVLKVYEAKVTQKDLTLLSHTLRNSDKKIMALWMDYATRYKSNDEKAFVAHVDLKMQTLHRYIRSLSQKVSTMYQKNSTLSLNALSSGTRSIQALIKKLIDYELKLAHALRKEHLERYESQRMILFAVMAIVTILLLILFVPISNSIKKSEKGLKVFAKDLKLLNHELHTASITDSLTGLFNRRYFDQIFGNEILRAQREKLPLTFMMLDIDHFKKYNDFYGHPAGDEVIKKVAAHLSEHFKRPGDLIFRLGGEEFGILVLSTKQERILTMADGLITGMQAQAIAHEKSETDSYVSLSMGMVHFVQAKIIDPKELYEMTDEQLYEAKETGRNKMVWKIENI